MEHVRLLPVAALYYIALVRFEETKTAFELLLVRIGFVVVAAAFSRPIFVQCSF